MIEKVMPKVIQNDIKIELWVFRGQISEVLGGPDRGPIFDESLSGKKMTQIWKNETEVRKWDFPWWGRRQRRGSRRAFGVCKINKNSQSLQTRLGRPVPCEQGAADLKANVSAADP